MDDNIMLLFAAKVCLFVIMARTFYLIFFNSSAKTVLGFIICLLQWLIFAHECSKSKMQ